MKKLIPIVLILLLAVIVVCFAACGDNGNVDDSLTSMSDQMTSMTDESTTLDGGIGDDVTGDVTEGLSGSMDNEGGTSGDDLTDENMSGNQNQGGGTGNQGGGTGNQGGGTGNQGAMSETSTTAGE